MDGAAVAAPVRPGHALLRTLASTPSTCRRDPHAAATFGDIPVDLLKLVCKRLDPASAIAARSASVSLRDACCDVPMELKVMLPMQSCPWQKSQLGLVERRINGLFSMLQHSKMKASKLKLCMEGADVCAKWVDPGPISTLTNARLLPLLSFLECLSLLDAPIQCLEVALPCTAEVLRRLHAAFPGVTTLQLDNLLPEPHNHVAALTNYQPPPSPATMPLFPKLRRLDVCLTAWDQLVCLGKLTGLTDLTMRYAMWQVPEMTPWITQLNKLTSLTFKVVDDRARLQLNWLSFATSISQLSRLSVSLPVSRSCSQELWAEAAGGLAWLDGCRCLTLLQLDLRVPRDAERVAQGHFKGLRNVRAWGCKVEVTVRADALMRERSYENAASETAPLMPRVGAPLPADADSASLGARWGCLDFQDDGHTMGNVHFTGMSGPLRPPPDLSGANLRMLRITNAALSPPDFRTLATCTMLRQLFISFVYVAPAQVRPVAGAAAGGAAGAVAAAGAGAASAIGPTSFAAELCWTQPSAGEAAPEPAAAPASFVRTRRSSAAAAAAASAAASSVAAAAGAAAARGRPSSPSGRRSLGGGSTTEHGSALALAPLLSLERLEALEVREEAAACVRQRLAAAAAQHSRWPAATAQATAAAAAAPALVQRRSSIGGGPSASRRTSGQGPSTRPPAAASAGQGASPSGSPAAAASEGPLFLPLVEPMEGGCSLEQHRAHMDASIAAAAHERQALLPLDGDGAELSRFMLQLPPRLANVSLQLLSPIADDAAWACIAAAGPAARRAAAGGDGDGGTQVDACWRACSTKPTYWRVAAAQRVAGAGNYRPAGWPEEEGLLALAGSRS